jgi:hypothetical protein
VCVCVFYFFTLYDDLLLLLINYYYCCCCCFFQVSCNNSNHVITVIALNRLTAPPPNQVKCVAYDFNGGFENLNYDKLRDEEGNKVSHIADYYEGGGCSVM